jgi:hypothetical protein
MKHLIKICMTSGLGLLISTTFLLTTAQAAGMYKWTDEQGNVHYSQQPPRDKQYERMKVDKAPRSASTPPASSSSTGTSGGSQTSGESSGSTTVEDELAKNAEIRKKNCEAAKKNLQVFQVYRRVKGEDGKIRVVTEKEREEQIQRSKEAIREFCD